MQYSRSPLFLPSDVRMQESAPPTLVVYTYILTSLYIYILLNLSLYIQRTPLPLLCSLYMPRLAAMLLFLAKRRKPLRASALFQYKRGRRKTLHRSIARIEARDYVIIHVVNLIHHIDVLLYYTTTITLAHNHRTHCHMGSKHIRFFL